MAWTNDVLVIANRTAGSDELLAAMLAQSAPCRFTLVVPRDVDGAVEGHGTAARVKYALARFSKAGLQVRVRIGGSDPVVNAVENYDPMRFDKIIVSTLPVGISRWSRAHVPARIRRLTGATVIHVEAARAEQAPAAVLWRVAQRS